MSAERTYRPDIDGLRAVAVLAVALFHGGIAPFEGGFVGVDVFFVISGYLITGIIARELAEGRFSIWRFYERRLRRIGPALAVVAIAVALFTLAFKTPREANLFGESITFVVLMISNFFFFAETGYFGEEATRFALLHTWSLSVEEQFYVIWPPLMILLFGRWARWRAGVIFGLAALSLIGAAIALEVERMAAFYLSPFRFWELMIGAVLALGYAPRLNGRALREGAAALGLAMILASVFLYWEGMAFPGFSALLPTLGTALVIHAGEPDAADARPTLVARLLSLRPVVFVGLCSYSFYLWHWPALSFASYARIRPLTESEALAAIGVAFLLSVVSLYLVERPFRRGGARGSLIPTRAVVASGAAAAVLLTGVGLFLQSSKGWPARFPELAPLFEERVNRYGLALSRCEDARDLIVEGPGVEVGQTFCRFGPKDAPADFLVWGDSHSLAIWPAFAAAAEKAGRAGYLSVFAVCPPLTRLDREFGDKTEGCRRQNGAALQAIDALELRQAVLIASWSAYGREGEGRDWLAARAAETVAEIAARGAESAIVAPVPTFPVNVPSAVFRLARLGIEPPFDVSRAHYDRYMGGVIDALAASGAPLLRSGDYLCDPERCRLDANGLPLYSDSNHLNEHGAALLAPAAEKLLASPSFADAAAQLEN